MLAGSNSSFLWLGWVAIVLAGLAVASALVWWILRAVWFPRRRRGSWWPVRPETVGPRLWPIVRPNVVIPAALLQLVVVVWIYFPPPWPPWVEAAIYPLAFLLMVFILYRTEVRGMTEGWVHHRSRPDSRAPDDRAPDG